MGRVRPTQMRKPRRGKEGVPSLPNHRPEEPTMSTTLDSLIALSRELGREDRQLAILGEGNTSADNGDGTFWIKASGSQLGTIEPDGFSLVRMSSVMELLTAGPLSDAEVAAGLRAAMVDPGQRLP